MEVGDGQDGGAASLDGLDGLHSTGFDLRNSALASGCWHSDVSSGRELQLPHLTG